MNIITDVKNRLKLQFKQFKAKLLTKVVITLSLYGGDFDPLPSTICLKTKSKKI